MMFLLTEEEYRAFKTAGEDLKKKYKDKLQQVCTLAAEHVPVQIHDIVEPWGCIVSTENTADYCDRCPVKGLCPHPVKQWSK